MVRYLVDRDNIQLGMAFKDWGLGILVDSRELSIDVGPFFLWWGFR